MTFPPTIRPAALALAVCVLPTPLLQEGGDYEPLVAAGVVDARAHGVWRSRGYGWIADLSTDGFALYDHGSAGTIRVDEDTEELVSWLGLFRREGDVLVIASAPENSTSYTFDRIDALPAGHDRPPEDDPLSVFDYFWECMRAHYAFFGLHGVDWEARRERHRPRIGPATTDPELFAILCDMLRGLHDDHLVLEATIDGREHSFTEGRARVLDPALATAFAAQDELDDPTQHRIRWIRRYKHDVATTLLENDYRLEADGRLVWGRIGSIGYVNVTSMGGFARSEDLSVEVEVVGEVLSRVVGELADSEAIIVDVTLNTGGYDEVQLAIAGHFAAARTLAFTKFPADTEGARPQPFHVVPASGNRFLGPVALVTSDFTVSAAEDFTLAMRALDNVTHWGMATRGSFSDLLGKTLPNGWQLYLSNEVYLDAEGEHWEGRGIPPEVPLAVFDPADIEGSHVEAIFTLADELHRAAR